MKNHVLQLLYFLENCLHEQMEKIAFLFPHQSCTLKKYVAQNSKIDSRSNSKKEITSNQAIFRSTSSVF